MSTIKKRAKALSKELQKLYDDAEKKGEGFSISFEAYTRYYGEYSKDTVGFTTSVDEIEVEEEDEDNEVDNENEDNDEIKYKTILVTSPDGAWYTSTC